MPVSKYPKRQQRAIHAAKSRRTGGAKAKPKPKPRKK